MSPKLPTTLPGETLRKAVEEYCELKKNDPEGTHRDHLEAVAVKFDLSPMQCEFLDRQLKNS